MAKATIDEKVVVLPDGPPGALLSDIDLSTYHETHAGSLVLDPACVCFFFTCLYAVLTKPLTTQREARIEFGDEVASRLKLSPDGKTVLWPQPSDDPEDPQNVRLPLLFI